MTRSIELPSCFRKQILYNSLAGTKSKEPFDLCLCNLSYLWRCDHAGPSCATVDDQSLLTSLVISGVDELILSQLGWVEDEGKNSGASTHDVPNFSGHGMVKKCHFFVFVIFCSTTDQLWIMRHPTMSTCYSGIPDATMDKLTMFLFMISLLKAT